MMKNKILKNWPLMILALLVAFVIWFVVVQITDPVISQTFEIPVEFQNESVVTDNNQVVTYVAGEKVRIKVSKERSVLKNITEADFSAIADYAKMYRDAQVPVTVTSLNSKILKSDITQEQPSIEVKIENLERITRVVEYKVTGEPAKGYKVGKITVEPSSIDILCPESQVPYIKKAFCTIDVTDFTGPKDVDAQIELFDGNDTKVDAENPDSHITIDSKGVVKCNVDIEQIITVNLVAKAADNTAPAAGYEATFKITPETITICGSKSVVSEIKEIIITEDVTGLKESVSKDVDVRGFLGEGVEVYESEPTVKLEVTIAPVAAR